MKGRWLMLGSILILLCACFVPQVHDTTQNRTISLKADDLPTYGVAFITPSTVTGQEEEKQEVALTFAEVLKKERPSIRSLSLPETLNAINQAGLSEDYKRMYDDYRDTGLFNRDILQKVGAATKTRYVAQIKLMAFSQGSDNRLGVFGLRMINTKYADLRLFFQIWNTQNGTIAWEGVQEIHYAIDRVSETPVTQRVIIEKAAHEIISKLP
ncbi:MAG: hypothetical protein ACLP9S_05395 [Syntrophales bacterium]|jgi:hypothetical protein